MTYVHIYRTGYYLIVARRLTIIVKHRFGKRRRTCFAKDSSNNHERFSSLLCGHFASVRKLARHRSQWRRTPVKCSEKCQSPFPWRIANQKD